MKLVLKVFLSVFLLFAGHSSFAQDINSLEKKKGRLEDEINFANQKIKEFRKLRSNSSGELKVLSRQIEAREEMIQIYSEQKQLLEGEIAKNQFNIEKLKTELEVLKKEYASQIVHTYKNYKDFDLLLYIFSASTLKDMYQRSQYLKEISKYRRKQLSIIDETKSILQSQIDTLSIQRDELTVLLDGEQRQKSMLDISKRKISSKIQTFQKKERSYAADVRKNESAIKAINKEIEREIAKARAEAERKAKAAREKAKKNNTALPPSLVSNTKLSADFAANKGKLPWPVGRGTIVKNFGKNLHPILRNPPVYTENNGIDIQTTDGAVVKAVFEGEIMYKFYNPTTKNGVIVMHGDYFSVYTGLKDVNVKEGDRVQTGTKLGTVFTNPDSKSSEIHIEIWKEKTVQNPNQWLNQSR